MSIEFIGFNKAALKLTFLEPKVRTRVAGAIVETTNDALSIAKRLVHRRSGELAGTLRADFSASGMTGQVKAGYGHLPPKRSHESARIRRIRGAKELGPQLPGVYAAIVEFGSKSRPAHPFLVPAVEAVRSTHAERIKRAIAQGVVDAAGGSFDVG